MENDWGFSNLRFLTARKLITKICRDSEPFLRRKLILIHSATCDVADEMLAILSDHNWILQKKDQEDVNARRKQLT